MNDSKDTERLKLVILAGGLGTRLAEETHIKPKPMVEIGGMPILWHIMKLYSAFGVDEFIICCGYKGYVIKEYFANYFLHMSDVTFNLAKNEMHVQERKAEPWLVTLVDTGLESNTAGRLKRVAQYLNPGEPFCFTYGDGLADVNISDLIDFHVKEKKLATLTAAQPPGRFGSLEMSENSLTEVSRFVEKPIGDGGWINGGFFVLEPSTLNFINHDQESWESDILPQLAEQGELSAFLHYGFWQPMDTLRDRQNLEEKWASGVAPWKMW